MSADQRLFSSCSDLFCDWWECLTGGLQWSKVFSSSQELAAMPGLCALLQVRRLYTGPQDDEIVGHAVSCNSKGPLLIHIAKLFPKPDVSSFDAFGRIFSGTVKPGDKACAVTTTCACPGLRSRRPALLGLSPCIDSVAPQQLLLLVASSSQRGQT